MRSNTKVYLLDNKFEVTIYVSLRTLKLFDIITRSLINGQIAVRLTSRQFIDLMLWELFWKWSNIIARVRVKIVSIVKVGGVLPHFETRICRHLQTFAVICGPSSSARHFSSKEPYYVYLLIYLSDE